MQLLLDNESIELDLFEAVTTKFYKDVSIDGVLSLSELFEKGIFKYALFNLDMTDGESYILLEQNIDL